MMTPLALAQELLATFYKKFPCQLIKIACLERIVVAKKLPLSGDQQPSTPVQHLYWTPQYDEETDEWGQVKIGNDSNRTICTKKFRMPKRSWFSDYSWRQKEDGIWAFNEDSGMLKRDLYLLCFTGPDSWRWGDLETGEEKNGTPEVCPFEQQPIRLADRCATLKQFFTGTESADCKKS